MEMFLGSSEAVYVSSVCFDKMNVESLFGTNAPSIRQSTWQQFYSLLGMRQTLWKTTTLQHFKLRTLVNFTVLYSQTFLLLRSVFWTFKNWKYLEIVKYITVQSMLHKSCLCTSNWGVHSHASGLANNRGVGWGNLKCEAYPFQRTWGKCPDSLLRYSPAPCLLKGNVQ